MELWNKLFTHRKKNEANKIQKTPATKLENYQKTQLARTRETEPPFPLQKDGIRVLLFRDCDTRGRKLLYDSKTVVQVPLSEAPVASTSVPSCKTLFKASWGVSGASGVPTVGSGGASQTGQTVASRGNKARAPTSSKPDVYAEVSGGYGYQYLQQENDTKSLGDLVFGTVEMAYRGSCSKLHLLHHPHRLLLSRNSPAPPSHLRPSTLGSDAGIGSGSLGSSISSLGDSVSRADSLEVPWGPGRPLAWEMPPRVLSSTHSEGDSGIGGPSSPYSSNCGSFLSPPSLSSTPHGTPTSRQGSGSSLKNSGSLNSLQRRFLRNVTTSLEALGEVGIGEESGGGGAVQGHSSRRSTKLGIAVIIQLGGSSKTELERQVEEWLFLHIGVVEGAVERLQAALDLAYLHRHSFVSTTHHAVTHLQQDIMDLVCGARLVRPVWLGLAEVGWGAAGQVEHRALCSLLVHTLASVLHTYDTKTTNFFISKLLTAVLTHHLGWVSTVAPSDPTSLPPTSSTPPHTSPWVEQLAESHPYSAVWAQLCELSGAVGYPPRTARTLLLGSDTHLLSQLLTVLSYIIRCSQVVEQDIQPHTGCSSSESQQQQQQQQTCSRTSSMASVVTVVEGGQRDSQRDCSTRQNSLVQLQRESSLRRSWRKTREGRGSRLLPVETRAGVEGSEGTKTGNATPVEDSSADPNPLQMSARKECDQASKWMLNDGEEIVIHDVKSGAKMPLETPVCEYFVQETKRDQEVSTPLPSTEVVVSKPADGASKTLSKCKTSTNLASLGGDEFFLDETDSKLGAKVDSERLYPTLYDMDDHRETFGPMVLEPDVIAEKVHKLFRGSSRGSSPQEQDGKTSVCHSNPQSCINVCQQPTLSQENIYPRTDHFIDKSPPLEGSTTFPRTKKSQSAGIGIGFMFDCAKGIECLSISNSVKDSNEVTVRSQTSGIVSGAEVRVPAENIHPEVEEGGKVLLICGDEDKRLELPKEPSDRTEQNTGTSTHVRLQSEANSSSTNLSVGFEDLNKFLSLNSDMDQVTCLPSPVDTRRLVRMRNVGRESARDLTTLGREMAIYPSLSEFKQEGRLVRDGDILEDVDGWLKKHRRHHSDPTNGLFVTKLMKPDIDDTLNDVAEEYAGDRKASFVERSIDIPTVHSKTCRKNSNNCDPVIKPHDQGKDADTKGGVGNKKDDPSPEEDSCLGELDAATMTDVSKEPIPMPMPRCGYSSSVRGCTAVNNNLAASLLGGVLDHYSSVFVVQATTQAQHWEDTLRQDLHTAAHRPTFHQPVAEAVAVVADTDSWEVEVVSSHSYVVERGARGTAGLQVGMSPLVSAITDSILHLTQLNLDPVYIVQHLEERLSELYLKSQLLASYLLEGAGLASEDGSGVCLGASSEATLSPHHLPNLTRALGLDMNDLPLLLAVASTHTPALTRMFGLSFR
ncbi:hypothetical protein Pmani_028960 [Petrolisthes manimaculis]|uniref:UDENN FNIP1/2-type domain-containing protein n=1 Tax=Petrolisthes manimaculis TaxID=1843537 RepID=A0AAE1P161_9EUCA|nr:hypothetical protein Pmani_028960 [Petrolisthes manimaculis]